jgi:hypothetical protein
MRRISFASYITNNAGHKCRNRGVGLSALTGKHVTIRASAALNSPQGWRPLQLYSGIWCSEDGVVSVREVEKRWDDGSRDTGSGLFWLAPRRRAISHSGQIFESLQPPTLTLALGLRLAHNTLTHTNKLRNPYFYELRHFHDPHAHASHFAKQSNDFTHHHTEEEQRHTHNMSLTNCRFYEEKYPEVESFVMVNVKQIAEMGAYVKLLEYGASRV